MTIYNKQPTNIQQQIQQLQNEGIKISDTLKAEQFFKHVAFHRLRTYWILFENSTNPRKFNPNTKLEDILNLYFFDDELRDLIFSAISKIEISLRATFSNLSVDFNSSHFYLNCDNFTNSNTYRTSINKVITALEKNKDELFIAHYQSKYTQPELPPVWSISEILTIGELYYWITNLGNIKLDNIAKIYNFPTRDIFKSMLKRLTIIRNICAHHGRLWNRKIAKEKLKQIQKNNTLKDAFNKSIDSNITFYGTYCYLSYMLLNIDKEYYTKLNQKFALLILKYNINTKLMGFPDNWQHIELFVNNIDS